MDIQCDEVEQLSVTQLSELQLRTSFENIPGQALLGFNELVYFILHGAAADEFVDEDVAGLADAEGTVHHLVLGGGRPPAVGGRGGRGGGGGGAGAAGGGRGDGEG